jgi:hypothetical protein
MAIMPQAAMTSALQVFSSQLSGRSGLSRHNVFAKHAGPTPQLQIDMACATGAAISNNPMTDRSDTRRQEHCCYRGQSFRIQDDCIIDIAGSTYIVLAKAQPRQIITALMLDTVHQQYEKHI